MVSLPHPRFAASVAKAIEGEPQIVESVARQLAPAVLRLIALRAEARPEGL